MIQALKIIVLLLFPSWSSKSWNLRLCHFLVTNYTQIIFSLDINLKLQPLCVPCWLCRQFLSSSRKINLSMLLGWTVTKLLISVYFFVWGLLAAYEIQNLCVKWSATQTASYSFGILNGTRQGFCLSLILFTMYMDGLLVKLRESGLDCYIGDLFLDVVAFCDDFLLLSPTRNGLQNLLHFVKLCLGA